MPLAPDAGHCAVCGARVPLIARPTAGDDDAAADAQGATSGADRAPHASAQDPEGVVAATPTPTLGPPAPGPGAPASAGAAPGGVTSSGGAAFDAAAAARDVRTAGRAPRTASSRPPVAAPPPVGTRVLAYAIDVLAAAAAAGLGFLAARVAGADPVVGASLLGLLVGVAQVVAEGLGGATLGAYLLGLRTVDERSGGQPGVPRAFVRQLVAGLGVLGCLVGTWVVVASGVWDKGPQRRGWHDKASGTLVVTAGAATSAPGRQGRAAAVGGQRAGARPWTPTPPPVGPVTGAPGGAPATAPPEDALFAPPVPTSPVAPPPGPDAGAAVPPAPDLVPDAPAGAHAAPDAPVRPEADLLPPPPEATRRTRGASRPQPSPPRTEPVAAPAAVPAAAPHADEDLAELEHTRVRDPESLRRRTGTLALHFDTGERVRVVGRGLVGRGPRAEDGQDILHVVVLSDAARSLSRVHVEFGPEPATTDEDAAIWVTDRGSTNGTVVVDPTGAARVLPAGARAVVRAGWVVRLGDREARVEDD